MRRSRRALPVCAVLIASLLWGAVTGDEGGAALCAALALASLLRPGGVILSTPVQALLLVGAGLLAGGWNLLAPSEVGLADRALARAWPIAGGGALLLAASRTHLEDPEWGVAGTLGLGLVVFLACGSVTSGPVYLGLLVPYVLVCFAALRLDDGERTPWSRLGWRHATAVAVVLLTTAAMTAGLADALPRLYDRANEWAIRWIQNRAKAGFQDGTFALGSLEGLLRSDRVVLRIEGPPVGPLRGNVYAHYGHRSWQPARVGPHREVRTPRAPDPDDPTWTVLRYAAGDLDRFFLPADTEDLHLEPTRALVDGAGVLRPMPDEHPERVWIRTGSRPRFRVAAPSAEDLQVPASLAAPLAELATLWTAGTPRASDRLESLVARLERDYTYSLAFERGGKNGDGDELDPVLDFLLRDPQGHCEYFASALALLARSVGIPARVVTGYRVVERNPLGDYSIVRERHAHAWVEAHLPGRGWVTADPSPVRSFEGEAAATTPWVTALLDLAVVVWQRHGIVLLISALIATFLGIQIWRLVRPARAARSHGGAAVPGPPAYLQELLARLRDLGLAREPGESLEAYARRVAARGVETGAAPRLRTAERLLLRYAAWRYGGIGTAEALRSRVRVWLRDSIP